MKQTIGPISPENINSVKTKNHEELCGNIPLQVFNIINEAIEQTWNGKSAILSQNALVSLIAENLKLPEQSVVLYGYLNIEHHYEKAGWSVKYAKPSTINDATFIFTKSNNKSNDGEILESIIDKTDEILIIHSFIKWLNEKKTYKNIDFTSIIREYLGISKESLDKFKKELHKEENPKESKVYIQNVGSGYLGNSPMWWSANGGYTQWIEEAEQFSIKDANNIIRSTSGTHNWKLWDVDKINSIIKKTVDIQDMRKFHEIN